MKILINNFNREYLETIFLKDVDNFYETFHKFSLREEPLEAKIFAINETISSYQISKLKKIFAKVNISSFCIYSNDRNTIIAGKSQKIDSTFVKDKEVKNNLLLLNSKKIEDFLHVGTVRSGDRISSNGNLCVIGDVNPGAIVSANNNIYVWGKLLGIAIAGKSGNSNASISSLFLKPLQLRIADVIAIGPQDKPKNFYPEIAVVDNQTIIIKPFLIETKN